MSEWEFMERVGGELSEWDFMKRVGGENGTGSGTEVTAAARTSAGPPSFAAEKITGVNGSSASPIPPAET